jgi:hypothetical protein
MLRVVWQPAAGPGRRSLAFFSVCHIIELLMKNQSWITPLWTCGKTTIFRAKRYYSVSFLPQSFYLCAFGKYLYNFYQTKKGRIT